MKVIISMSGLSSRFAVAGYDIPKFMIEVDGKTVIQHIVELYPQDSEFLFIINDNHDKDKFRINLVKFYDMLDDSLTINLNHKLWNIISCSSKPTTKTRHRNYYFHDRSPDRVILVPLNRCLGT